MCPGALQGNAAARHSAGVIAYSALISACEQNQEPTWDLELSKAMQRRGIMPDAFAYIALIGSCKKSQEP